MAHNTIEEIKNLLLLENENQTMSDEQIQTYINDANLEMTNEINRTAERDSFLIDIIPRQSSSSFTRIVYPFFNVKKICSVKVNDEFIDSDKYEISIDGDGILIQELRIGDVVETITIPSNYKMFERAICIVNIRTRLNPFKNNTVDPIYNEWVLKRDNFKKALKSKFGTALYNG